jgi:Zn-finger protein
MQEIENYVPHEASHGNWYWTSSQGHICDTRNCEINQNPRSLQPILKYLSSRNDKVSTHPQTKKLEILQKNLEV